MAEPVRLKFRGREHRLGIVSWTPFGNIERMVLAIACIVCGGCCIGIGDLLGVPREPHFNGSLLLGGAAIGGIVVVAVSIALCMLIGVVIAAFFTLDAGLFCCCIGLAFFAVRCGPIRPVLQYAAGAAALITLALETAIFGALLIAGWLGLTWIFDRMQPAQASLSNRAAPNELTNTALPQKFGALGVQVVAMMLCEQILIQSDVQAQVMAGTLISAFAGAAAAYSFRPMAEGIWYWAGAMLTGTLGYLLAYFFSASVAIGDLHGWTAPLARPTPLVYISMGTAGALLGHWCIRRWSQPEDDGEGVDPTAATP